MSYDEVYKLSLEKGFFAPGSEIYSDAPAGFWEYGPLGVSLRNRYVDLWRRELVRRDQMLEIDGSQVMSKSVFKASGHLDGFADPIVACSKCGTIARADRMIAERVRITLSENLADAQYDKLIEENKLTCVNCKGRYGSVRKFNMMFRIGIGPRDEGAYLRPETCQSIFVDYIRLFKTMRAKLPIAFAQFGKSFRNEISPRQGLLRLREFYQAEIEVFFNPEQANIPSKKYDGIRDYAITITREDGSSAKMTCSELVQHGIVLNWLFAYYLALVAKFYSKTGIDMSKARFRELARDERAFYAASAYDFEVKTSIGWLELVACNYRSDYDLSAHAKTSGRSLVVEDDNGKVLPHIFEISMGIDRSLYTILEHSMIKDNGRNLLRLPAYLSPVQVGVFPLVNKNGIRDMAKQIHEGLKLDYDTIYDSAGSIGRRYRRQDELGTPICITVDYASLTDDSVTLRLRDSMGQERIHRNKIGNRISEIISYIA